MAEIDGYSTNSTASLLHSTADCCVIEALAWLVYYIIPRANDADLASRRQR
jgi:hypothetical protein